MTKKRTQNKVNGGGRKVKASRAARVRAMGLDVGALAHRRLLLDPCNAPLSGPAYTGGHTGLIRRYRRVFQFNSDEVERVDVFQFGTNSYWTGGHSASQAGNPVSLTYVSHLISNANQVSEGRCIAGCVKIRYTGSEMERAGTIGLHVGPVLYGPSDTPTVTMVQNLCPHISRVGEVLHEVKFVPSNYDQNMVELTHSGSSKVTDLNNAITIATRGVPAGSIQLEVTFVMEVDSFNEQVANYVEPASSNTLDQVLRSLGSVSSWAFTNVVVPTIKSGANAAMRTFASGMSQVASNMALVTL